MYVSAEPRIPSLSPSPESNRHREFWLWSESLFLPWRKPLLPANPLILCACGIQDPGNLGTLVRTAAAARASMVCTTPGSVSARNPKAIRASAGTFFHIPVIERVSAGQLVEFSAQRDVKLYRTDAAAARSYLDCDFRSACAVLLGNESAGVAADEWQGAVSISIPTAPGGGVSECGGCRRHYSL